MTRHRISPTRRAIRDSIFAQMAGALLLVLFQHGGIAALLIIALIGENSEFEIGCAFFVMQWAMLLRLLAAPHVDTSWRRRFLVKWSWVATGLSCLFLTVPAVGAAGRPQVAAWLFVVLLGAYFSAVHTGAAAWFPLLSHILPHRLRGRYFGNMRRAWQITGFGTVLLSGLLMRGDPGVLRFYLVLVPAVALQFARVIMYARLPDPPPAKPKAGARFWRELTRPLRDGRFRLFLGAVAGISLAQSAAIPFVVPFLRTELHFPASVTLYGTACLGLGSILTLVHWGRLADRWGNRVVFLLSVTATGAAVLIFAATPDYNRAGAWAFAQAAAGLVLAGVGTAGSGIAYTVRLMYLAPARHSGPYMNAVQGGMGLIGGVTALITGLALSRAPDVLSVGGIQISTFRIFFIAIAAPLGLAALLVRRLPPIAEPRLRHIAVTVLQNLPAPFVFPLLPLQRILNGNETDGDAGRRNRSQRSGN